MINFCAAVASKNPEIGSLASNLLRSENETAAAWRASLDAMWPNFCDLADENYVSQFCSDPCARAWEMQLGFALRCKGLNLSSPKPRKGGPDFLVQDASGKIWVEAVVATSGDRSNLDRIVPFEVNCVSDVPNDGYVLRIASVLDRKRRQIETYRDEGLIAAHDRCVIAVCAAIGSSHFVSAMHAVRAVYPVGYPNVTLDRETMKIVGRGHSYQGELMRQGSDRTPIPTTAFLDQTWSGISGVLFWEQPYVHDLPDVGLKYSLIHNYVANNIIEKGWWKSGYEYWYEESEPYFEIKSRSL